MRRRGVRACRGGFTLLELLVVIAIIALLLSILLPGLGRARKAGMLAVSMNNLRQLNVAGASYKDANKGRLPLFVSYRRGSVRSATSGVFEGFCTWSFGGKNNNTFWSGKFFDIEAADRPVNAHIFDQAWDAPAAPELLARDAPSRKNEAKVFRDPGDMVSHQRTWPKPTPGISCYDDVGSSYQYNAKWWEQLRDQFETSEEPGFIEAFEFGVKRMSLAENFNPSKFAWLNDQYADIVASRPDPLFRMKNGYGDVNKAALAFLDGHASYFTIIAGRGRESYTNDKYTFVFEDLRVPGR